MSNAYKSSAPCLWGTKQQHKAKQRCYARVITGTGYCPQHQPEPYGGKQGTGWQRPATWTQLREQAMRQHKGICHICGKPGADEVDHLTPLHRGGTNALYNLRPVHAKIAPHCHRQKTAEEANRAKQELKQAKRRGQGFRPGQQ